MTVPQIQPALSASDTKILHAVFDPESAPEAPRISVDPSLPLDPHITDPEVLASLRSREVAAIKVIEGSSSSTGNEEEGVKHAAYLDAKARLDAIIAEQPTYASAWNNRAQLSRWRYGDRGVLTRKSSDADTLPERAIQAQQALSQALTDLSTAISLATPSTSQGPGSAVSPSQGKILAQAWTQRAAIYWGVAKDLSVPGTTLIKSEREWEGWDKMRFEEEGSRAFFVAGLYGSEVGRAMAVLSNPTAKLCGSIVKEALRRERGE